MKKIKKLFSIIMCILLTISLAGLYPAASAEEGYKATFVTDEHVSVTVSTTQSFEDGADITENASSAYARDSSTGEIDISGNGQINFLAIADDGYTIENVTIEGSYKNLKSGTGDTDYENGYRITKIKSDLTITITTTASSDSGAADIDSMTAQISDVTVNDGYVTSAVINSDENISGRFFAAVYNANATLAGIESVSVSSAGTIALSGNLAYDDTAQTLKCFLLNSSFVPIAKNYTYTSSDGDDEGDGIIHLYNTYIDAAGIDGVSIDATSLTISQAGTYYIEGSLDDGQINIASSSKSDEIILNLTNVNVTSSTGNALNATKGSVTIINSEGSESTFTSNTSEDVGGAAIYSKNDLTIKGDGILNAVSTGGNGIRCKADLEIGAGDINVTAYNNGIKGDESVKITKKATNITVTAQTGDAIKTDAINSSTLELEYGKGNITINGGNLNLTAAGDGIQADDTVTISGGTITINSGSEGIKANTTNTPTTDDTNTTTYIEGCVVITGGAIDITTQQDGIKGAGSVDISGGSITIDAVLDGIQSGVDYKDESENTLYSQGDLTISGGEINITAGGTSSANRSDDDSHKGIKAYNDLTISGGKFNINSYDDSIHSNLNVNITDGTFEIATADDGIHADYKLTMGSFGGDESDYYINISTSYEGIEGSVIDYLSGTTYIYSTDDGVNAAGDYDENGNLSTSSSSSGSDNQQSGGPGSQGRPGGFGGGPGWGTDDSASNGMLYIRGGKLYVVSKGDGLDSNGDINMSGGVVVVNGPTSGGNGVFDKGDNNNTFTVTGGTLVGFGTTSMPDNPSSVSNGYVSTTTSLTAGKAISVTTDSGSLIIVPQITLSRALLYVTCADMTKNKSYSVSTNASSAGAENILVKTSAGSTYGLMQK